MYEELIKTVNDKCREFNWENQGIFREPYGIPVHIKEPVIYMRYETGGIVGGSCWDDSDPQSYHNPEPTPHFHALVAVLTELKPNLTFLQFRAIEGMIQTNGKTEYEYYGNCTDWMVMYIPLSKIVLYLEDLA